MKLNQDNQNKYNKELTLEEIRKIQLDALIYIRNICNEHDIDYYLMSGTLLGAVKYKGYIPWDDDVDIALKRKDYLKLIKVLENDSNSKYKILSIYNTRDYYYPFAKLVCKETKLYEKAKEIKDLGVYIDIFPLDYYNEDYEEYINKIKIIKRIVINRYKAQNKKEKSKNLIEIEEKNKYQRLKSIIINILDFISKPIGLNFWAKLYDKLISKNETGPYITRGGKYKEKFPAELFNEFKEYEFEGNYFKSIKNADIFLRTIYGDYIKDLPKEKQRSHHEMKAYWKK